MEKTLSGDPSQLKAVQQALGERPSANPRPPGCDKLFVIRRKYRQEILTNQHFAYLNALTEPVPSHTDSKPSLLELDLMELEKSEKTSASATRIMLLMISLSHSWTLMCL
jgi:hypothetical protein